MSPAYRQRIKATKGYSKRQWLAGEPLPRSSFGHGRTPSHGAREALTNPARFPEYISKHISELNEYRRQQGERELQRVPYGRLAPPQGVAEPYTVVNKEDERPPGIWHSNEAAFDDVRQAQNYARESGAPPGIVQIFETADGRFQVMWTDDSSGKIAAKARRQRIERAAAKRRKAA